MAEFDTIAKHLIHTYPHDFARFALHQDDVEVLDVIDTEQPTVEAHRTDSLLRVRVGGEEALVHHEFQTTDSSPPMPQRMAGYIGVPSSSTAYPPTPPSSICVRTSAGMIRGTISKGGTASTCWCNTK